MDGRTQKTATRKTLCDIIKPRVEEILSFVDDEITKSPYKDLISSGVIITGGAIASRYERGLRGNLRLPTIIGIPQYIRVLLTASLTRLFACAIGLVKVSFRNWKGLQGIF